MQDKIRLTVWCYALGIPKLTEFKNTDIMGLVVHWAMISGHEGRDYFENN